LKPKVLKIMRNQTKKGFTIKVRERIRYNQNQSVHNVKPLTDPTVVISTTVTYLGGY
jgi:hypothetical protein